MRLIPFYLIIALVFVSCRSDTQGKREENGRSGIPGNEEERGKSDMPGNAKNNGNSEGKAIIEFSSLEHDFGKIEEGEKVACVFTFQNKGDSDLLITSASTSCGCTVPDFDNKPVPPGENGRVEVVFDSSFRNGAQSKTVTIRSNAEKPVVILKIKAEVVTKN
ncbi:MAG: DUF1573 domain-containing protein [Bacteroidales bacterium]|jgi:hypothetical protein|nr:DUF1573 domain-containing protein [Bacteroidales bacterium]